MRVVLPADTENPFI